MICIYYANIRGGVNNLSVALDSVTGEHSSSLIDKEHAVKALSRKLSRHLNNKNGGNLNGKQKSTSQGKPIDQEQL